MIFKKIIAMRDQIDLDILKQLVRLKFVNARQVFIDKFFNFSIWAGCTLFVTGYLMKSFGLTDDFGPFQLGGILAGVGIFELYGNAVTFVSDLEGDRTISYYLTLPTHTITVLCSHVLYYATIGVVMSLATMPLAKLILWNKLSLLAISWPRLLFFILLINIFCASATLLLSAFIPSMDKFDILWTRIMFPLWFLGGFQFSWYSVYQSAPKFAAILLLNPFLYMAEGVRAALLGQDKAIPFWICCLVLSCMLVGTVYVAYKALKKRLDFV
jgi:ABC-2 type transport system permease protein